MTYNLLSATGISNYFTDAMISLLFVLFTVATLAIAVWLLVRNVNKSKGATCVKALSIIIIVGVVLRIVLSFLITGNRMEHSVYVAAISHWTRYGVETYIARNYFKAGEFLHPLSFYIFGALGSAATSTGIEQDSVLLQAIIKLPLIIADVVSALIVYNAGKRFINGQVGTILASVVMLCPVFIFTSAVWGGVICLLIPFILASFHFLAIKKYELSIAIYSLSMLVAREAIYLFPVFAVYYGYVWIKSIVDAVKRDKKGALKNVISISACVIAMTALNYLICLPMTATDLNGSFWRFIDEIYLSSIVSFRYFSNNALGLYNLLVRGATEIDILFPKILFVVLFAVIVTAFSAVIYLSRKNRAVVSLGGAYIAFLLFTCYIDLSATFAILVLALLLLSFIFIKDKRILKIFAAESILSIINMCAVFVSAGYYNSFSSDVFVSSSYSGLPLLQGSVGGIVVSIVLSVLSIAVLVYTTKVVIDIAMSDRCRYLGGNERIDFSSAVKDFIRK